MAFWALVGGIIFARSVFAQSNKTFSVLSYNIAALPGFISSSNPKVNIPLAASRLTPYGIVNVQEDFNYHEPLYAGDTLSYRTPTSGGVPLGSGLNTMSIYPLTGLQRVTWNWCWINFGDCLTPKGFTMVRAQLDENAYIDVYNLHTDAGDSYLDAAARKSNIGQVVSYVKEHSEGNAVLIYGDTNALYTNSSDGIRQFITAGFTDVWVQLIRGQKGEPAAGSPSLYCPENGVGVTTECETLDEIFYRSGSTVRLNATRYNNESDFLPNTAFLDSAGRPLSDHYPITADFIYSLDSS
ncbi:hypothetical protein RhiJN_06744 [Ceratobasidium sp. AG-Ba]|nr:hypothetical protein RhiJN_06744 [Ceratobasidium sp. AG-Ba]QRW07656.1 hypothetical protein RhiLY_06655 [Ceratobasidium sp. AG-Ba]